MADNIVDLTKVDWQRQGTSFPENPEKGWGIHRTDKKEIKGGCFVYDGEAWVSWPDMMRRRGEL